MKKNALAIILVFSVVMGLIYTTVLSVAAISNSGLPTTYDTEIGLRAEYQILTPDNTKAITLVDYESSNFSLNTQNVNITSNQRFLINYVSGGKYEILTMDGTEPSDNRIGVMNGNLYVSSPTGDNDQLWYFVPYNGGYVIRSAYDSDY